MSQASEENAVGTRMIKQLYVGGEWEGATGFGKTFEVTNPANGGAIAPLTSAGRDEM